MWVVVHLFVMGWGVNFQVESPTWPVLSLLDRRLWKAFSWGGVNNQLIVRIYNQSNVT